MKVCMTTMTPEGKVECMEGEIPYDRGEAKPKVNIPDDLTADYIQSVIDEYRKNKIQATAIATEELEILDRMKAIRETLGQETLVGTTLEAETTIPMNVTYEQIEKQPALKMLRQDYEYLNELIRVEIKESGSKVDKFLESCETTPHHHTEEQLELAAKLRAIRIVKPGKLGVKIKPRG